MPTDPAAPPEPRTLAQRLSDGRLPVREAVRYATLLGEALRKLHDAGNFHGALAPRRVMLAGTELSLLPARGAAITPYTAPEALEGQADARSDIFSFGAIFYEMMTGQRAFSGEGAALVEALAGEAPPSSGSLIVDAIAGACLAKDPAERCPTIQKILTELRLLTLTLPAPPRRAEADFAALRTEMQQVEARVTVVEEQLAAAKDLQESMASAPTPDTAGLEGLISARIAQELQAVGERIAGVERTSERFLDFERNVAADFQDFESGLKRHEAAIQSARTALSQSDDVVERVVEALESIQSAMLDHGDARPPASAPN